MDAEIIRNLLKCNLTDEESHPIHLEEEDLAEGIVECEASTYEKVLSLKEGFISFGPLHLGLVQQDGLQGALLSIQAIDTSSPRVRNKHKAYNQHALTGTGNFLGYSKGTITLQQDFRTEINGDTLFPILNETFRMGIWNANPSDEIIILETVTSEAVPRGMLEADYQPKAITPSFYSDHSEEPHVSPTLQFFNYHKVKNPTPTTTEKQSPTSPKGKAVATGPDITRTPSKRRFHPYVESSSNGSQSKKPSLSTLGLDGSEAPLKSAEATYPIMELSRLEQPPGSSITSRVSGFKQVQFSIFDGD
ncbi:hypothetical protein LIER_39880 [Lithospermum erythrorhizon]|uniref:Uncharacterized protein n=1 Tax=Lithospermum erythrorhizon TaxID=34254 RepID=A0AAV3QLL7_LITER